MRIPLLFIAILLAPTLPMRSEPVPVKYQEGSVHGFLLLRDTNGKLLASGDLTQVVHGDRVVVHVLFQFKDGSTDDERAVFTQRGVFHLITDRHIQKGPSFPNPMDVLIDASKGNVIVHYSEKGTDKTESAHLKIPPDIANGVIFDLLKNVPRDRETKLGWIAATPKPRLVKLSITSLDQQPYSVGGISRQASRYLIKVELGGLAGVIAPLIGKEPPDMNVWIAGGEAPEFLRFQGPQYLGGPVWEIKITGADWRNP